MRGRKTTVAVVAPGERLRDAEGRWKALGEPTWVRAHVAPGAGAVGRQGDNAERAGRSDRDDGVVLLPRGTAIDPAHVVQVRDAGVIPDGDYRVRAVTRTVKHVRVALVRVKP